VRLPFHILLPLASAILYMFGALLLKRASDLGADSWQTTRVTNYCTALASVFLLLLGGTIPDWSLWWHPPAAAVLFFSGQIFTLLALTRGDISVATPVLGLKILLVAILSTVLIGDPIGARLWTAAALSSAAIALLNVSRGHAHAHVTKTIILAALGALSYALFDVLVQKWSPPWGTGRFLPIVMMTAAVYSLALPRSRAQHPASGSQNVASGFSRTYQGALAAGAALFAIQGLMFISSISFYRHATLANVVYSSRGLWSVLGVWAIGHWFANREQHLGMKVLIWRFVGAILMMAALLMVFLT
jgi:drug/metabolite transporter (DMT)-like permease